MPPRGHPENQPDEPRPDPEILIPHGGMWATVIDHDIGDETVTVTVDDFDEAGTHTFGPVPYIGSPDIGDVAFLHFDQQARPAYAVCWNT